MGLRFNIHITQCKNKTCDSFSETEFLIEIFSHKTLGDLYNKYQSITHINK